MAMQESVPWWRSAVVYQIYPAGFADSNGDGLGDLGGVLSRLNYLAALGIDAIWLTPFYPSPRADGGYDVADYCDVDPRQGTLADFDALVTEAGARQIRVIVDLVPNHCSDQHPLFQEALTAGPGSPARDRFLFRDGRGPGGTRPPNNWQSEFGGPAWTRVTEPGGAPGQWYLHLFDDSQPDWNWRNPAVRAYFEDIIRFWLDRGAAGLRVDVAHGLFKDADLADDAAPAPSHGPSGRYHQPELAGLYRSWRSILDSYPAGIYPGQRTAIGEAWYDDLSTVRRYLAGDGLPQVFNFGLIHTRWHAGGIPRMRSAVDASLAMLSGRESAMPWVLGSPDVPRPVTRFGMTDACAPLAPGANVDLAAGERRARAAVLLLLALPGSAYIYQGEELGLPDVLDLPPEARTDPIFRRSGGTVVGRDGCRVPLPWSGNAPPYGFSSGPVAASPGACPPQPSGWQHHTVAAQSADPGSTLNLYRAAVHLRRAHPALGEGTLAWLDGQPGTVCFARAPGFAFAANLGAYPAPMPAYRDVLLASGPLSRGQLPPDTAVWLATNPP